ncbi:unnamed protein product [Prorocentrum cordatum]|uniref:Uncharacterized protein n=1 Tax=Prorocentrum cordatum TaxID=2364126 RepID=A0ABN9VJB9_9DINO|nr:unnamed protein product [Polarella glacialis]
MLCSASSRCGSWGRRRFFRGRLPEHCRIASWPVNRGGIGRSSRPVHPGHRRCQRGAERRARRPTRSAPPRPPKGWPWAGAPRCLVPKPLRRRRRSNRIPSLCARPSTGAARHPLPAAAMLRAEGGAPARAPSRRCRRWAVLLGCGVAGAAPAPRDLAGELADAAGEPFEVRGAVSCLLQAQGLEMQATGARRAPPPLGAAREGASLGAGAGHRGGQDTERSAGIVRIPAISGATSFWWLFLRRVWAAMATRDLLLDPKFIAPTEGPALVSSPRVGHNSSAPASDRGTNYTLTELTVHCGDMLGIPKFDWAIVCDVLALILVLLCIPLLLQCSRRRWEGETESTTDGEMGGR